MSTHMVVLFPLIGLALGSFGTVLITRLPAGQSIGGRSRCPRCKKNLRWFDLIPVLSYVVLAGRCSRCGKTIPELYPLVELGSAAVFLGAALYHRTDPVAAVTSALIVWALLLMSIIDAKHRRIPDMLTAVVAAAATVAAIDAGSFMSALTGAALCLAWFGGQWLLSRGRWVGSGDVLLGAALGLWVGGITSIGMLQMTYVFGMLWIVVLMVSGRIRMQKGAHIAFGPLLAVGAVAAHTGMADWYLRMIF